MISYFGGKNNMNEFINKFIPRDIKYYGECFSGAFWTYINVNYKFPKLEKIIYNDFNGHMANLYACMREHKTFLKYLETSLTQGGMLYTSETDGEKIKNFYRELFYKYKKDLSEDNFLDNPPKCRPDFDAGVIYAFLITSSFNGCYPRSCGASPVSSSNKPKITALLNKLRKVEYQEKLENITDVYNEDFEVIINKLDNEDSFIYIDPPYFSPSEDGTDTGKRASWYGTKDFNYDCHMRLLNKLKTTKCRWALSYYYFKELEDILPKDEYNWQTEKFFRSSASFSDSKNEQGEELLIMNYTLSDKEIEENKKFFTKSKRSTKPNKALKTAAKKYKEVAKPSDELLDKVFKQVKEDIETDYTEAVYELLSFIPIEYLEGYLPEEDIDFKELATKEVDEWSDEELDAVVTEMAKDEMESDMDSGLYEASGLKEVFESKEKNKDDDDFWS